jgi:hypothetical protein
MNTTEDRLRRATRAAADTVAPGSAPPLHLPSRPDRRRGIPGRPRRYGGRRGQPGVSRPPGRGGGWPGWATPLAAAAVAAAVVVASAAIGGIVRATQGAQGSQVSLSSAPPYYLALIPSTKNLNGPQHAVIRSTVTGATEATIRPPEPFNTFSQATGAADDRTFVLGAQSLPAGWTGPAGGKPPAKFFVVHFSPAHGTFTMAALPIPEIGNTVQGIALSPDGTRLAITNDTDPTGAETQVRIYSLASGAVRVWQSPGTIGNGGGDDQDAMSWAADDKTLAFNWTPATKFMKKGEVCFTSVAGVLRLLNTATAGGGLLADSRLARPTSLPSGVGSDNQAILTPDGTKIIIPVQQPGQTISAPCLKPVHPQVLPRQAGESPASGFITFEFEVFSTATGKLVDALRPVHIRNGSPYPDLSLAWSNSSGSVLVVQAPTGNGRPAVLGVLSGDKFIPIPGAPPVTGGIPQLVF